MLISSHTSCSLPSMSTVESVIQLYDSKCIFSTPMNRESRRVRNGISGILVFEWSSNMLHSWSLSWDIWLSPSLLSRFFVDLFWPFNLDLLLLSTFDYLRIPLLTSPNSVLHDDPKETLNILHLLYNINLLLLEKHQDLSYGFPSRALLSPQTIWALLTPRTNSFHYHFHKILGWFNL